MNQILHYRSLIAALAVSTCWVHQTQAEDKAVTYDQVRPVLKKHCVSCHGQERARGDLNLSTTAGIQAGSASGPVAIAGKPDESLLFTLAAHLEAPKMPPGAPKIPQRELDLIRGWIEDGLQERTEIAANSNKPAPKPAALIEPVVPLARPTAITAIAISPKESLVAVSGLHQVVLFSGADRTPTKAFPFPEGEVFALRFSRDGDLLLVGGGLGGESGKVVGIEVATGKRRFEIGNEADAVLACDVSADGSLIALGGPGKTVKVYRASNGELVSTLKKHTDWILAIAFSPDGLLLASSDRFGGLQVWEAASGKPFSTLRGHVGAVNTLDWSADSNQLLSGGQDGTLRLWDLHQGTQLKSWNAELGGILSAEWILPNYIVASGREHKVAVFDPEGQRVRDWSLPDEITEIAVTSDGNRLIAGDAAGHLSTWTVSTGTSSGELVLPLASQVAKSEFTVPARQQRSKTPAELAAARASRAASKTDAKAVASDTDAAREALAEAEAAVKSAEESLAKAKATAAKLKRLVESREAASNGESKKRK